MKRVYTFGNGKAEGRADMKNLLGGKGANLAEMNLIGVPVPPGFTITTEVCTTYTQQGREAVVKEIQGDVEMEGEKKAVKLISMQNPITVLKHKFLHENNTFKEIESKVLSLRSTIDVLILDHAVYFFSMAGENLFHMERAYKAVCDNKVTMVEESGILCESSVFGNVARTGHHPRMFVAFNEKRYERLKQKRERKRYAELFEIPIKDGKFDTSNVEAADKLVRLLCDKGMLDPFEELPVEVSGARKWQ